MNGSTRFLLFFLLITLFACRTEPGQNLPTVDFKRTSNEVFVRLPSEPAKLNPLLYRTGYEAQVIEQLYSYLMDFSYEELSTAVPVLVTGAPQISDAANGAGKVYRFEIRPEARWDNGDPITGRDVEFTLKAIYNPTMPTQGIKAFLDFLEGFRIDENNPRIFEYVTSRPYVIAEEVLGNLVVIPSYIYDPKNILSAYELSDLMNPARQEALKADAQLQAFTDEYTKPEYSREKLVGSGPYRLKEWVPEQRIVLERKADWWGNDLTGAQFSNGPEEIHFLPITDNAAVLASLYDEGFDVSSQINSKDFLDLQQNEAVAERYDFHTPLTYQTYYMGMNGNSPKLADKRVRQAIAHTINIEEVIEKLFYGFAQPTTGFIDGGRDYYNKDLPVREQDFDKAKQLLADAGWTDTNGNGTVDKEIDGVQTELELTYFTGTGSKYGNNFAQYLRDNASRVGISIVPEPQDFRQMMGRIRKQEHELAGLALNWYPFPHDLRQILHTESNIPGGYNYTGFGNEESDRLLEEIQGTVDREALRQKYLRLQEIFYEEAPAAAIFNPLDRVVTHKRFVPSISPRRPGYAPAQFQLRDAFKDAAEATTSDN